MNTFKIDFIYLHTHNKINRKVSPFDSLNLFIIQNSILVKNKIFFSLALSFLIFNNGISQNEPFSMRVVNTSYQLNSAWEITWGPDDSLWVTENNLYFVSRIDPATGGKTLLICLLYTSPSPRDGLLSRMPSSA